MELFRLLAKLTLDSKDFDKSLKEAEKQASGLDIKNPTLDLDDKSFRDKISDAQGETVDDQTPVLDLDDQYTEQIHAAQDETVDDQTPELGLDATEFDNNIGDAQDASVDDMTGSNAPKLGLDAGEFNGALSEAETTGGLFKESLGSIFSELSGLLVASGIATAVTSIVGSLKEGVELAKNTGDAIHKQSSFIGLTTDAYQELDYALNLSGASLSDFSRGFKAFQQMKAGDITDDQADAFERLGIKAEEAADSQDLMLKSLYALADYTGDDRDIIAKALFGNNYNKLNRLLEAGSNGIKEMQQEAHGLGLVMSEEEIQNAADYMDATTRMEESIKSLKTALVKDILPFLTDAANTIANIVALLNPRSKTPTLVNQLQEIDTALAGNVENLENNEAKAQALLDKLVELGDYNKLDAKGQKTWDEVAKELIDLFPQLDGVIDTDNHVIKENTDSIKANIKAWTELEEKRLLDQNLADKRQLIAEQYAKALDKEVEAELRETEAASKQKKAIAQLNEILGRNEELRNAVQGRFGTTNVTAENAGDILKFVKDFSGTLPMGLESVEEWNRLQAEAEKLRTEADKLNKEADEASESYTRYAEALADKLGITIDETEGAKKAVDDFKKSINEIPTDVYVSYHAIFDNFKNHAMTHATGSDYIPFDNYPALLHRGEKVLTATEARQQDRNINVTDLEDRIIAAIREGMADATVNAVVTDREVARGTNRFNGKEIDSRRFTP